MIGDKAGCDERPVRTDARWRAGALSVHNAFQLRRPEQSDDGGCHDIRSLPNIELSATLTRNPLRVLTGRLLSWMTVHQRQASWMLLTLLVTAAHLWLPSYLAAIIPRLDAKVGTSEPAPTISTRTITSQRAPVEVKRPQQEVTTGPVQDSGSDLVPGRSRPQVAKPVEAKAVNPASTQSPPSEATPPDLNAGLNDKSPPEGWAPRGQLEYTLSGRYGGREISGSGRLVWEKVGSHYSLNLDVTASHGFKALFVWHFASQGKHGPDGLAPDSYEEEIEVIGQARTRQVIQFDEDKVVLPDDQTHDRLPGMQDPLSAWLHLARITAALPVTPAAPGATELSVALPQTVLQLALEAQSLETLYSPFGALQTQKLASRQLDNAGEGPLIEVWVATELQGLPVRVRMAQSQGAFVVFEISSQSLLVP